MSAPIHVIFRGLVPGVSVSGKVRPIPAQYIREHGALCQAFGFDPVRTKIDVPRSWGEASSPGRSCQALVFFESTDKPLGYFEIFKEGLRVPDGNPSDPRDHYDFNKRI